MTRLNYLLLCLLTLPLLPGCGPLESDDQQQALVIMGEARYQQQTSLPAGSSLTLRLENLAVLPERGALIAEKITRLEQQQNPTRFQLRVYPDQLHADTPYLFRALLETPDGRRWTTSNIYTVSPAHAELDLGTIMLNKAFAEDTENKQALFVCGKQTLKTTFKDQQLQLHLNDDIYHLQQVVAASGAKYQSADGQLVFWNKGVEASLQMASFDWPACTQVSPEILSLFPFHAQGNEPGWTLSADVNEVALSWNYGQQNLVMPYPQLDETHSGFVLHTETDQRLLRVNVLSSLCRDTMSGRPYPQHVDIMFGDLHLSGCGGYSYKLLTGAEWVVEDLDNRGIIDASRVTMLFDDKGRLSGLASCNRYTSAYEFDEQLDIADPIATRKACAPALMNQEKLFLSLIARVSQIDFDEKGALLLSTADGSTITARR